MPLLTFATHLRAVLRTFFLLAVIASLAIAQTAAPSDATAATPPKATEKAQAGANDTSAVSAKAPSAAPTPSTCAVTVLGPSAEDASTLQKRVNDAGGVTVHVVGARTLMLCGPPANVDTLERALQELTGFTPAGHQREGHLVRLFYLRQATEIASVINNSGGLSAPVKAIGEDLLLFPSESNADDAAIRELKQWIAILDVPRPEVSLEAWSLQISSKDPKSIISQSAKIEILVSEFNDRLHLAFQQGWRYIDLRRTESVSGQTPFFSPKLVEYVTGRYIGGGPQAPGFEKPCPPNQYCLGYSHMFSHIQPSLASMLIALIATEDSMKEVDLFVDCLESRPNCARGGQTLVSSENIEARCTYHVALSGYTGKFGSPAPSHGAFAGLARISGNVGTSTYPQLAFSDLKSEFGPGTPRSGCEMEDWAWGQGFPHLGPSFSCLRQQLEEGLGSDRNKALVRSALVDFLFYYKTAEMYPQDLSPWNRAASAQLLDNAFNPFVVEFNRDIRVYLRGLRALVTGAADQPHNPTRIAADQPPNPTPKPNAACPDASEFKNNQKSSLFQNRNKKTNFSAEGIVSIEVTSGEKATVSTTTQSYFTAPPVFSVTDFLNGALGKGGSAPASGQSAAPSKTAASALSWLSAANPDMMAAQALLSGLNAQQPQTAQVGRNLNLIVRANTLSGASAADLDVQLDSGDSSNPSVLEPGSGSSSKVNLDRVAKYNTATKVRVDSVKLFQVSAFSATISHGRSVPLIPPFVEFPYIGSLASLRLQPGVTYHRSFAIVNALVVPTAADLGNAFEFYADREPSHLQYATWFGSNSAKQGSDTKPSNGSSTTSVSVQQTPPSEQPVSVSIGGSQLKPATSTQSKPGTKGKKGKQAPPVDQGNASQTPDPKPAYYWVVTHFRTRGQQPALSIAGPFAEYLPKSSSKVQVGWSAPPNADTFDLYKAETDDFNALDIGHFSVKTNLKRTTFSEDQIWDTTPNPQLPKLVTEQEGKSRPYLILDRQPGWLMEYHRQELACLAQEADRSLPSPVMQPSASAGPENDACPKLDSTPLTGSVP